MSSSDPFDIRLRDFPKLVDAQREAQRRQRLARAPDLTYLFWECTLRCNLRCAHCGSSCTPHSPVRELTTAEVKGILETIAEDFDTSRIFVSITGGEPLLRKDLFEVVEYMTELGLRSCIVTNGTLLDDAAAARLVAAGMRTVTISLDGLQPEHDEVRGRGTFPRTLAALGAARRAGMRIVEAITCVRPANLDDLPRLERMVREAGANRWRLITIDRMGRLGDGADTKSMWLEPPEVRRLMAFVAERRQASASDPDFGVRFSCGGFLGLEQEQEVRPEGGQCYAGLVIASILADGQVSACPSLPRSMAQGSALEKRFSEVWRERFARYRDFSWRKSGPCADCSWFPTCLGGGLHERLVQPEDFCWLERQCDDRRS